MFRIIKLNNNIEYINDSGNKHTETYYLVTRQ
jgi:hypothetical protein